MHCSWRVASLDLISLRYLRLFAPCSFLQLLAFTLHKLSDQAKVCVGNVCFTTGRNRFQMGENRIKGTNFTLVTLLSKGDFKTFEGTPHTKLFQQISYCQGNRRQLWFIEKIRVCSMFR